MTCRECGGTMAVRREAYKYDASGLPNVVLQNVEVRTCPACGERSVAIPRITELHLVLAHAVATKPAPLTPAEICYLRKYLGLSSRDFAQHMGTTPESVSRWEHGKLAMSPAADRLLRLMVMVREPVADYALARLKDIMPRRSARPLKMHLALKRGAWTTKIA